MITVFFSYAHEDADLLDDLVERHMQPLVWERRILPWVDRRQLRAGHEWRARIHTALDNADLVVLFLTSAFFGSEFVVNTELKRALGRQATGAAEVVPVLVNRVTQNNRKTVDHLQIVPGSDAPIYGKDSTPASVDDAWVHVTEEIERVVDELSGLTGFPDQVVRELREFLVGPSGGGIEHVLGRPVRHSGERRELRSGWGTAGYHWPWRTGSVYWTGQGVFAVHGAVAAAYAASGGPDGLGFPLGAEADVRDSANRPVGRYQRFEGVVGLPVDGRPGPYSARVYWRSGAESAHVTAGAVGAAFEASGGPAGPLGFPRAGATATESVSGSGVYQSFERGMLCRSDRHGVVPVVGRMAEVYVALGGPSGRFGFPVAPVVVEDAHRVQEFEGGAIAVPAPAPADPDPAPDPPHLAIAAGSMRVGHQELFAALPDGRVVHRSHYGEGWSGWAFLGSDLPPIGRLATLGTRGGAWGVGVAEREEPVVRLSWFGAGQWSPWETLATPRPVVSIAAGSYAAGRQNLFVAADDGAVHQRWKRDGGGWSSWTWFDAPGPVRRLACGSHREGLLDVYAVDARDGTLRTRRFSQAERWSTWTSVEIDSPVVALAQAVRRDGRRELFVACVDGRIRHRWAGADHWSDWRDFGTVEPVVDLAVANPSGHELAVFAVTTSGRLLHRRSRAVADDWGPWEDVALT